MMNSTTDVKSKEIDCPWCNGTGRFWISFGGAKIFLECSVCRGYGKIVVIQDSNGINMGNQINQTEKGYNTIGCCS